MVSYKQIEKYHFISFDVFDTLIRRSVAKPTDLFDLMEKLGEFQMFAQKRREAGHFAEELLGRHATLDEIYAQMGENKEVYKEMEIQMEIDGCQPNPVCVELFHQCIAAGKTVVLISDMYLPSSVIGKMLEKCGVVGYQKLYVSSEQKMCKRDGALYRKVLNDLGIKPRQIIHIGDNLKGDVICPLRMGISVAWIKKHQKQICRVQRTIADSSTLMQRTIQVCVRNASEELNDVEKYGCAVLGPLLYGFMIWLVKALRHDGIHEVYFMAREGLVMKRAFALLGISDIKTHYLLCSRRSYVYPLFWKCQSLEEMLSYVTSSNIISLREFLLQNGLDAERYKNFIKVCGIDIDYKYSRDAFTTNEAIRKIYEHVRDDVAESSKCEFDALTDYLSRFKMSGRIALVDIGYHGTMQNALIDLLRASGITAEVKGYYVGIAPDEVRFISGHLKGEGYLFSPNHGIELSQEIRGIMVSLFEAQFLAPHGSVEKFVKKNGYVIPSFYDFEYVADESMRINEKAFIQEFTNGGMIFLQYMLAAFHGNFLPLESDVASYGVRRLGCRPSLKEAKLWGDFRFINYGKISYLAFPRKLSTYLMNPTLFVRDISHSETWKVGFLKRLLRVPFPYFNFYNILRKIHAKL